MLTVYTTYLRRRGSENRVECNITDYWVKIFDPASPISLKNKLKKTLRENVEVNAEEYAKGTQNDWLSIYKELKRVSSPFIKFSSLPSGMTIAMVMCQGYEDNLVYASFKKDFIAERFVLIGYSTGRYDTSKIFKDGTSMVGRIFITEEDLEIIRQNSSAPMMLVDRRICTGLTISTIGKSLKRQLGYSGKLYEIEDHDYPRKWDGAVYDLPSRREFPTKVPILTELSRSLSEVRRISS
jgi:hypothetical protein